MSDFLYFVPDGNTLEEAGLSGFCDADGVCVVSQRSTTRGPNGGAGRFFSRVIVPEYKPDSQVWREFNHVWIGHDPANLPTPDSLRRKEFREGPGVILNDGRRWKLVAAREWTEEDDRVLFIEKLPRLLDIGDDGKMHATGPIVKKYRKLWELSTVALGMFNGEQNERTVAAGWDAVCESLSLNYWIGPREIAILGLLDPMVAGVALRKILDIDGFFEQLGNLQSRLVSTAAGGSDGAERSITDNPADTDPQ